MICVHIWSVSAVSFHSAKGRGGQNSSRLFPVIFTWNEVLLAAFDLPRDTSQDTGNAFKCQYRAGAFPYFRACKLLSHMQQKFVITLGLNFAATGAPLTRALAHTLV